MRHPDGVVAPEQRDGDAGEAEPGLERRAVRVAVAEQDRQADEPGHGARDQHRQDDHPLMLIPLAIAAVVDRPVARRSNPNRVLLSTNQ